MSRNYVIGLAYVIWACVLVVIFIATVQNRVATITLLDICVLFTLLYLLLKTPMRKDGEMIRQWSKPVNPEI